jgi:phosphoribosylformylglycinamidine synthase subunit PurQ / glutaminase
MAQPRVLVLRAPGTNCDEETAHAFSLAGGKSEPWHVNRVLEKPASLADFQILCIPGGFSYGDDIAAGRILGNQLQHHLADTLRDFHDAGKLIIGICNGFQVLLKTNLLATDDDQGPTATLTLNDSGHFEARWVRVEVKNSSCVFVQGIEEMELPVAHAEGKFVTRDARMFAKLDEAGQFVLRYGARDRGGVSEVAYPHNPNGSMGDVAGMCDATGRVFGLMPHPERFVDATQHPAWTRFPPGRVGDGLRVFQNAVRYFQ